MGIYRINRIRLEFKVEAVRESMAGAEAVLIESDWNLKLSDSILSLRNLQVLIESDWNLKL